MIQDIDLIDGYKIKHLSKDNSDIVENLCERCSDYYIMCDGELPSKQKTDRIFTDIPSNKKYQDKFVLGVYKFQELIGIVDIIKDYPTIGEWMLGLMLIEPQERGNGLGKIIHQELIVWAKKLGAKSFRIGVIEENHKAFDFWSSLGYTKIKTIKMKFTSKTHKVHVMKLHI